MSLTTLSKRAINKFLNSLGLDLRKYNLYHSDEVLLNHIIKEFKINTVIDVGANEGQYALSLLENGYKGKIYSFEPIPSVYEVLKKRTAKRSLQWKTYNLGIGSTVEELTINVSKNLVSSSILEVENSSVSAEPNSRIQSKEKINITTLDSFFSNQPPLADDILLKLDIQGYELEALKGALRMLPTLKLIQVELSFVSLYHKSPLFHEVVSFIESNGFDIFTLMPGFRDPKTGRLLQADGVFINTH